jgi:transposase
VKVHRNAKTTHHTRALLVQRVRTLHWPVADAATAAGIATRTAYKWLARYREGGSDALQDRSSCPHRQPRRTDATVVAAIVAARHERLTAWAIAGRLQVPRSTVAAVLARAGLNRLALIDRQPVTRYERTRPGELVHLDIKPLGRILRVGHRIPGAPRHSVGAGWEYVHVAVDDYSRAAYVEVLPSQNGATTAAFLRRPSGGLHGAVSRCGG